MQARMMMQWRCHDIPTRAISMAGIALSFATPTTGWLVVDKPALRERGMILATTDGGRTWRQQYPVRQVASGAVALSNRAR